MKLTVLLSNICWRLEGKSFLPVYWIKTFPSQSIVAVAGDRLKPLRAYLNLEGPFHDLYTRTEASF